MLDQPLTADDGARNAATLHAAADAVSDLARRLELRVEALHYEGPAAYDFRISMAERAHRADRAVQRIRELADRLTAAA
jgi:hypothetical protein